jgi:pyocin large subunit-like protein
MPEAVPTPQRPALVPTDPVRPSLGKTVEIDHNQTVQSMLEQASELGVTVPRGMRKKAKAKIARYIDEQLAEQLSSS